MRFGIASCESFPAPPVRGSLKASNGALSSLSSPSTQDSVCLRFVYAAAALNALQPSGAKSADGSAKAKAATVPSRRD